MIRNIGGEYIGLSNVLIIINISGRYLGRQSYHTNVYSAREYEVTNAKLNVYAIFSLVSMGISTFQLGLDINQYF